MIMLFLKWSVIMIIHYLQLPIMKPNESITKYCGDITSLGKYTENYRYTISIICQIR